MPEYEFKALPFKKAIEHFRQKVNLPTEKWNDLMAGMHSRAFVVAGATKDALLSDLRSAIDKAMSEGMSLNEFREKFDDIVARYGWSSRGNRNWRTAIIFNTNMRTAYMAGRYKQMTDPDVISKRPYWQYRHGGSANPRPEHLAWDGLVLRSDDPWWDTHYPPNGFGCSCKVFTLSAEDLVKMGKSGPDIPPKEQKYEWVNPKTGEVLKLPRGVDPGWDYNVGQAAWGKTLSEKIMDEWRAKGGKAWETLTLGDFEIYNRERHIPADQPKAKIGPVLASVAAAQKSLESILGAKEKIFQIKAGDFSHQILVNAETLAKHIDLNRTPYLPLLPEAMEDPYEVWLTFEQHKGTGKVVLRQRIIKAIYTDKKKAILVVIQARGGVLEAWTMFSTSKMGYLNKQRRGKLIYGR